MVFMTTDKNPFQCDNTLHEHVCSSRNSGDGPTVTLPPIDYNEYKKREMQGQLPQVWHGHDKSQDVNY